MNDVEIQKLKDLDRNLLWHPFTPMQEYMEEEPLIVERGEGCLLFDIEGKAYLDGVSSLWVNVHGHRRAELDQAIREQLDRVAHSTLLGIGNVPSIRLAEKLLAIAPKNLKRVFYSDNGSTSVEVALKMAFQFWQQQEKIAKTRFVTLKNAYHGDTIGSVSVGGIDIFHQIFHPLLFQTLTLESFSLDAAAALFRERHAEIAACVVEPLIQGAAGMRLQPPGFLRGLRELCSRYDILLICDEVATGFGRSGKMFAVEHEGVEPDFLCLAKGITGGYLPLAATLTTERVFAAFQGKYEEYKTFFHGHSYTGNPLACAVALANLEIFEKDQVLAKLPVKIEALKKSLQVFADHPQVKEVRHLGLMAGIELVQNKAKGIPYPPGERRGAKICREARRHGVLLRPLGDVLVLMPPLAIESEQIQALTEALFLALETLCKS
ncbi:MAG TPA: adenosylmethionine--8-amino-7-oxononanoate transaminase [Deltaproteobacteria bacterium]|nr:adenosylmethionine--8-amino-7-oxononanoate transaminase [Deltaproteobacteria bacterium]